MNIFNKLVNDKRPKVETDEDKILYNQLKNALENGGFLADLFKSLDYDLDDKEYEYITTRRIYLNTFYDERFKLYRLKEIENDYTKKLEGMLNKLLKGFEDVVYYNFKFVQEDVGIKDPYIIFITVNVTELSKKIKEARNKKDDE